jgi:hypothetical protein
MVSVWEGADTKTQCCMSATSNFDLFRVGPRHVFDRSLFQEPYQARVRFCRGRASRRQNMAIWVLAFDLNLVREQVRDIRDICKDACHLQNLPCESERFCRPKHEVLEVCFGFRSRSTHERIVWWFWKKREWVKILGITLWKCRIYIGKKQSSTET